MYIPVETTESTIPEFLMFDLLMTELSLDKPDVQVEFLNMLADYYRYTKGDMLPYEWCLDCLPESDEADPIEPGTVDYYLAKIEHPDYDDIATLIKRVAAMLPQSAEPLPAAMNDILTMAKADSTILVEVLADMTDFLHDYQVIENHHARIEFRASFGYKLDKPYDTINASLPADQFPNCILILANELPL